MVKGTPGNALGSYLDGTEISVYGNVQEATGDTMNDGAIYNHGSAGDGTGYAMRGGVILIQGDTGYRTGVHMKQYKEKFPPLWWAAWRQLFGGIPGRRPDRDFWGFTMKTSPSPVTSAVPDARRENLFAKRHPAGGDIPRQTLEDAAQEDLNAIEPLLRKFCGSFMRIWTRSSASTFRAFSEYKKSFISYIYKTNLSIV